MSSTNDTIDDIYVSYVKTHITRVHEDEEETIPDDEFRLTASDIYGDFRCWFKAHYPNTLTPSLQSLRNKLSEPELLGPVNKEKQWLGVVLWTGYDNGKHVSL